MAYKYLGETYTVQASWEDAVHLSEDAKASLLKSVPEWQRDARSKGIPQLGSGAIFQISEDRYVVEPLKGGVPAHWPRVYALDVGIRVTAAVWMAKDPDSTIHYIYTDYDRSDTPYSIHAAEIKARGEWVPGCVDPAANQRSPVDGEKLISNYRGTGLILTEADNSVSAGLEDLCDALIGDRLKIFSTCQKLIKQMRVYRRDEKGKIVKKNDHLCDCLRYVWVTGRLRMRTRPKVEAVPQSVAPKSPRGWMA